MGKYKPYVHLVKDDDYLMKRKEKIGHEALVCPHT